MRRENDSLSFRALVDDAVASLKARDFQESRSDIADAMALNMDAPEPHNLLGILYELMGDRQAARKHYRAAYALDPTYKPSCRNLERLTSYNFSTLSADIDFGTGCESGSAENRNRMLEKHLITG